MLGLNEHLQLCFLHLIPSPLAQIFWTDHLLDPQSEVSWNIQVLLGCWMLQMEVVVVCWVSGESAFLLIHPNPWLVALIQCIDRNSWLINQTITRNNSRDNYRMAKPPNIHNQQPQSGWHSAIFLFGLTYQPLNQSVLSLPCIVLMGYISTRNNNHNKPGVATWRAIFLPRSATAICFLGLTPQTLVQSRWDYLLWLDRHRLYQFQRPFHLGHCWSRVEFLHHGHQLHLLFWTPTSTNGPISLQLPLRFCGIKSYQVQQTTQDSHGCFKSCKSSSRSSMACCFLDLTPHPLIQSRWSYAPWLAQVSPIHENKPACVSVNIRYVTYEVSSWWKNDDMHVRKGIV